MAFLRAALVIAARIMRQRLRDRSAIIFSIVTPLGLAVAFASLIPGDFASFHTRILVVDQDGGHVATSLVDDALGQLVKSGIATVDSVASEAQATAILRDEDAAAAVVIPAGFSEAVTAGRPTEVRILGGSSVAGLGVARAAVEGFASAVGSAQLMVATSAAVGATVDQALVARAMAAVREPAAIGVVDDTTQRRQASLGTFYGAAMAIMFVFFATQYGALAILADQQVGTLNRLLAAPIAPAAIVFGASLAGFALGLVSMTVLIVATTVLVGATWGPPLLVALLVLAAVVAAMGISTIIASVARTAQQAGGLNAIVAISMSAIGGVFIPLSQAPPALQVVSSITPHAWFIRGINTLSGEGAGLVDIAPSVAVLLAMGVVTGAVGLVRARRSLIR